MKWISNNKIKMNREAPSLADRYLPARQPVPPFLSFCSDSASTASCSSHLSLLESPSRMLTFTEPQAQLGWLSLSQQCERMKEKAEKVRVRRDGFRKVHPDSVLEADGVVNNFFYSCLDSTPSGMFAIGLANECYLYNQKVCLLAYSKLIPMMQVPLTALKFNSLGSILFAGSEDGNVEVIDVEKIAVARTLKTHMQRVGCILNVSPAEILTASKDLSISLSDLRVKKSKVLTVLAHHYEVCGLSQQQNSIASSDSAGRVNIWDLRQSSPFSSHRLFSAAVKALAWCPWKHGLLALGGGSKDPRIVLWNTPDESKRTIKGHSQVTALRWREQQRELVTTHGSGLGVVWDM